MIFFVFSVLDRTYKGYWANGRQHGKGVYIGSQGVEKEGEWSEGKRIKWYGILDFLKN